MNLAFRGGQELEGAALLELDPLAQAQLLEALASYAGERWPTVALAVDGFRERFGHDLWIAVWDVVDAVTSEARFTYWVQGAGDGRVFPVGSSDGCIGSVQHRFQSFGDDDAETLAWVEALQRAADRTPGL